MATAINITQKDFPDVFDVLHTLARRNWPNKVTRPSLRRLTAALLLEAGTQKLEQLDAGCQQETGGTHE